MQKKDRNEGAKLHFLCFTFPSYRKLTLLIIIQTLPKSKFPHQDFMAESLSRKWLKFSSVSNMLILTYFGLTPKCFPLLVKMLCARRKLSQSSTFPSHFNHTKAVKSNVQIHNVLKKHFS